MSGHPEPPINGSRSPRTLEQIFDWSVDDGLEKDGQLYEVAGGA